MNYNKLNPIFSFRMPLYHKQKLDKTALSKKQSPNEFAKNIMLKYLANELIEKTEDLDKEMIKLRIEKLRMEIEYQKLKIGYFKNFDKPLSATATRMLKPQIIVGQKPITQIYDNPQSPYDAKNKRLQCIDCGVLFTWQNSSEFNIAIAELQRHLVAKHNRVKTEIERDVLIDLQFEGAST